MRSDRISILAVAIALLVLIPAVSKAGYYSSFAQIKIVSPIAFQELKQLNFGVISPAQTDKYVEITPEGSIGPATTAEFIDSSAVASAKIKIVGSEVNNINIEATSVANEASFDIEQINAKYDGSITGELINGMRNLKASATGKDLDFGAKIKISANTLEGNYSPGIRLNVNYE